MQIGIVNRLVHKLKLMRASRTKNKHAAAKSDLLPQLAVRRLRGKVRWEGDLNESRLDCL